MPVGDFPTVFPTIMTCRLNRMVTSKNGNIHRRYCICSNTLLVFIDHICFADHEHFFLITVFLLLIMSMFFLQIPVYSAYVYLQYDVAFFLHIMDIVYCSWKDLFAIYMHFLHVCSTWKTQDGRKCVKNFGVLGVSGLNK